VELSTTAPLGAYRDTVALLAPNPRSTSSLLGHGSTAATAMLLPAGPAPGATIID
jgi:hypothetical protein